MTLRKFLTALFSFLFVLSNQAIAGNPFEEGNKLVATTLLQDRTEFQPSNSDSTPAGYIGIKFEIEPGWHIYWQNSGESGQPTAVNWVLPEGWRVGEVQWPVPTKFIERGNIVTYGYEGWVLLTAPLFNPPEIPNSSSELEIQTSSSWLVCKDICVPGQRDQTQKIRFSTDTALTPSAFADQFKFSRDNSPDPAPSSFPVRFNQEARSLEISLPLNPNLTSEKISNAVQFFPFNSDDINLHSAFVEKNASNKILIPLSLMSKAPEASVDVGGVLAIAPGFPIDAPSTVLSFSLSISPQELLSITKKSPSNNGLPLLYRVVRHDQTNTNVGTSAIQSSSPASSTPAESSLLMAILLGLFAGVILNIMPCVLPVLSIKIISLSLHRELSRISRIKYAFAYLLGIEATFVTLAVLVGSLKGAGMEVGWGFQFQQPIFVYALAIVVFAFSLGFFDFYFVTIPGSQLLDKKVTKFKSPMLKSFGEGVLITLLSTPCTAPFLGTALAFAFSQSTFLATIVFLSIGVGLAFPYVLVAALPALADRIPRPGHWMRSVKELMGFLLLGTVIWLLYVLDSLAPNSAVSTLAVLLWISFLIWCGRHVGVTLFWKIIRYPLLVVLIAVPAIYFKPASTGLKNLGEVEASGPIEWTPYTPDVAKSLLLQNKYVFIDFTADWCITCKFNERVALSGNQIADTFKRLSISPLKADWTDGSKIITEALESYGGHGVPLYVMLSPDGRTEVLPTILTPGLVEDRAEEFTRTKK